MGPPGAKFDLPELRSRRAAGHALALDELRALHQAGDHLTLNEYGRMGALALHEGRKAERPGVAIPGGQPATARASQGPKKASHETARAATAADLVAMDSQAEAQAPGGPAVAANPLPSQPGPAGPSPGAQPGPAGGAPGSAAGSGPGSAAPEPAPGASPPGGQAAGFPDWSKMPGASQGADGQPGAQAPGQITIDIRYVRCAELYFLTGTGMLAGMIGPEWRAKNSDEKEMVVMPLAAYLQSVGASDVTPGWAAVIAISAYCAPRFQEPNTREKLAMGWLRLKTFLASIFNRARRAFGPKEPKP